MKRLVALVLVLAGASAAANISSDSQAERSKQRAVEATTVYPSPPMVDYDGEAAAQAEIDAYLEAVHQDELQRFYEAVQAEAQRKADELARQRQAAAPTIRVGNCCGPHTDAWWWGVAICEQGGRNDPYFGYFSFMDGSAGGGKSWEEQVAMGNALLARVGREVPTWAQSCVDAGYRASPGG